MTKKPSHTTNDPTPLAPAEEDLTAAAAADAEDEAELADELADELAAPTALPRSTSQPQPRAATTRPKPAAPVPGDNLTRNLLFCLGGLVLGFALSFLFANRLVAEPHTQPAPDAAATTPRAAPPLDPTQTNGQLPPGHPDVNNAPAAGAGAGTSAAATSADAQQAMAAADAKPRDFDMQMNAAATFYRAGDFAKATLYLERALAIKPKDADALTALGNTKYDAGDFAGAAELYVRALAVEPRNTDVQTDLGNTYFRRTPPDYARAIVEYRKTLAIDPRHEKALQNLAQAALQLRDKTTAQTAVNQLASVNPNNPTLAPLRASLNSLP